MVDLFYDVVSRVFLIRYSGVLSPRDLGELDRLARGFVALRGQVPSIVDASGVSAVDVPTETVKAMGSKPPVMGDQWRVYVVPNPEAFGLLRLYATYQQSAGFKPPHLVRTMEEALRFLSIGTSNFTPYLELQEGPGY